MIITAFMPAKGGSARITNKNVALLDGDYLFRRKLRQLLGVPRIDHVYLDTDSDEIASKAKGLPVKRLFRPSELATNETDGHALFEFECKSTPPADIYIQALCTAPFVESETIERALNVFLANPEASSLVAGRSVRAYVWNQGKPDYGLGRIPNSNELKPFLLEGMSLYMVRRRPGDPPPTRRFFANPMFFELSAQEDFDINYPDDLVMAETICAGQRSKAVLKRRILKPYLTSSLLADLAKERRFNAVLPSRIKQLSGTKILGTAKTLALTSLEESEKERGTGAWRGIYEALNSYKHVKNGDIIVVATEVPGKSYFGDLNANIATRCGAEGVVIDGNTRDLAEVRKLEFSVFGHAAHCDDIKYEGRVSDMNSVIQIGDVIIENGDILFGDEDGVVVFRPSDWEGIQDAAIHNIENEWAIKSSIIRGVEVGDLVGAHGTF